MPKQIRIRWQQKFVATYQLLRTGVPLLCSNLQEEAAGGTGSMQGGDYAVCRSYASGGAPWSMLFNLVRQPAVYAGVCPQPASRLVVSPVFRFAG